VHHVAGRDRELFAIDLDDELSEMIDRLRESNNDVTGAFHANQLAQRHQRAPILLAQRRLTLDAVDQRTSGFEFLQHDVEQRRRSDRDARLGAHAGRHDVRGSFVREIHADPHDHGQTFVNGHDLGEEPAIFASPTIRSFGHFSAGRTPHRRTRAARAASATQATTSWS